MVLIQVTSHWEFYAKLTEGTTFFNRNSVGRVSHSVGPPSSWRQMVLNTSVSYNFTNAGPCFPSAEVLRRLGRGPDLDQPKNL